MTIKNFVKRNITKFQRSQTGIAYIWVTAIATLIFTPLIYWVLSLALDEVANNILASTTLIGNQLAAWTLVKAIVSAIPVIIIFTVALWSFINSKAKAYET